MATPLPLQSNLAQSSVTDLPSDTAAYKASPTVATKFTPKKRKVVSFADLPSTLNVDDQKDESDVIIIPPDIAPTAPPGVLTSMSCEQEAETKQKQVDIPEVSIIPPAVLTPVKEPAATTLRDEDIASPQGAGKSDDGSQFLSPLREILSDEESIASSVSSLTSDTSSLLERPTLRKRGGRRRGTGRRKKTLGQDQSTQEGTDLEGGESPTPRTSRRGGRGRRRGGRGGRSATELARMLSVEIVEDSVKAEG